jgi:hypothetical protein
VQEVEPVDVLNDVIYRLAFIKWAFCPQPKGPMQLSNDAQEGFHSILSRMEDELNMVSKRLHSVAIPREIARKEAGL